VITELDGKSIASSEDIQSVLATHHRGDEIEVKYIHREELNHAEIILQEDPSLKVVTYEAEGKPVTEVVKQFRKAWLGSKVSK
jgi:predicted metalloprotease with PDZ domain